MEGLKSFIKGFVYMAIAIVILLSILANSAKASENEPSVKMSKSEICHATDSSYYKRTKAFTSYETVDECLEAGGRLPKNYKKSV